MAAKKTAAAPAEETQEVGTQLNYCIEHHHPDENGQPAPLAHKSRYFESPGDLKGAPTCPACKAVRRKKTVSAVQATSVDEWPEVVRRHAEPEELEEE